MPGVCWANRQAVPCNPVWLCAPCCAVQAMAQYFRVAVVPRLVAGSTEGQHAMGDPMTHAAAASGGLYGVAPLAAGTAGLFKHLVDIAWSFGKFFDLVGDLGGSASHGREPGRGVIVAGLAGWRAAGTVRRQVCRPLATTTVAPTWGPTFMEAGCRGIVVRQSHC